MSFGSLYLLRCMASKYGKYGSFLYGRCSCSGKCFMSLLLYNRNKFEDWHVRFRPNWWRFAGYWENWGGEVVHYIIGWSNKVNVGLLKGERVSEVFYSSSYNLASPNFWWILCDPFESLSGLHGPERSICRIWGAEIVLAEILKIAQVCTFLFNRRSRSMKSVTLHQQISKVAQNGQTKQVLERVFAISLLILVPHLDKACSAGCNLYIHWKIPSELLHWTSDLTFFLIFSL